MDQYFSDVLDWLSKSESTFNRIIKMFCGRSIRRAKLYSLKILGSPVLARLAIMERLKLVSITRHDKSYLSRRLTEAMFWFPPNGRDSFPMNPFRVIDDELEFRQNPLLGIVALMYLRDNRNDMAGSKVFFASTISVDGLINYLITLRFSVEAIKYFISNARDSGLLRPVPSSKVLIEDQRLSHRTIFEKYVIDDSGLSNIFNLLSATDVETSMVFFNCATRARYGLGGPRRIDNWLVEAFTSLIFLRDFLLREQQLEKMTLGTGLMLTLPSGMFQAKLISKISGIVDTFGDGRGPQASLPNELYYEAKDLLERVKVMLRGRSSIL
jgi:hypothetical protein